MYSYLYGLTGNIITPENPEYQQDRQVWNRAIQRYPLVIVYCVEKQDVANAILWARSRCVPFRIRSGGHNYEGYSTGDALLVIDISNLNSLSLHDNLLTVGGGVQNSQIYDYVSAQGYPFPGGTCPTVGVAGYALGGGWGLSCRQFGLGCDNLVELELVNYQGQFIKANAKNHADLFWGCRGGGGGNFGVVVSLTFQVPPKTDKVTYLELYYPNTDQKKQAQFLLAWQDWLKEDDPRMTLIASIYRSAEEGFAVFCRGIFYGTPQEAEILIQPFTNLEGYELNLEYLTFLEAISRIEASYPSSQMFKSTGRFVVKPFRPEIASRVVGLIRNIPAGSVYSAITLYALGGKVKATNRHETAFFYREAQYIAGIQSVWTDEQYAQTNIRWVKKKFPYLQSVTQGSYVNFPYAGLPAYQAEYYGANAPYLRLIKRKYDPWNIFRFPQSIF